MNAKIRNLLSVQYLRTHIKQHMLLGLIVMMPVVLCAWILAWFWGTYMAIISPLDFALRPLIPFYLNKGLLGIVVLILILLSVYIIGVVVSTTFGAWFYRRIEAILNRVAFIYRPIKEVCELLIKSVFGDAGLFSHTVLLKTGEGSLRPGFVISDCAALVESGDLDAWVTVFFPHSPAPNSGNEALHRLGDLIITNVSPAEALKAMGTFGLNMHALFREYLP